MCFAQRRYSWKATMEGLNRAKEKDKKIEMSFSSGWLKERQEVPYNMSPGLPPMIQIFIIKSIN